jgi:parvulin-like peptidyl-prolyl isomerase
MHPKYLLPMGLAIASLRGPASLPAAETAPANVRLIEMIIAKVNGEIITKTELEKQREAIAQELRKKDPSLTGDRLNQAVASAQSDALRDQIDQLLLVQRAKDLSINVDSEITRRIAQIQAESKKADPEEFHKLVQQETGIPFEDWRNNMKNQLLTQRVIGQEVGRNINIPTSELKDYYEKHKSEFVRQEQVFLREILIATKDAAPEALAAAEKKAKDVCARARKGEKFGDLARSYSDAPTAQQDGELGAFKRGDLRKEIEDVVFKQNRGYVTDPIRTTTGFVILKVEERYEAGQASFEDVQNEIMEKLYMPKMQPEIRKYLTKLREDAFIEIRGGYVDSGAAPAKDTSWKDPAQLKPETTTKEEVAARHNKKRFLGVIPRKSSGVSSSNPSAPAEKSAEKAKEAPAASGSSTGSSSSGSSSSSSSSSSSDQ